MGEIGPENVPASGPVSYGRVVRIYSPEGTVGALPVASAASLPVLAGRTIGLLDNRKPNAGLVLEHIAARLHTRVRTQVARRDDKNAALPGDDQVLAGIAKEVEIVLTGTAD